jgi:4-aminobutyrate aminotransferase
MGGFGAPWRREPAQRSVRMGELADRWEAVAPDWTPRYYREPLELVRGEGRHVWDGDGNRYLDFFGGILTTISGHNVPAVTEAIQRQAAQLLHASTLYLSRPLVELAERIAELSGIPDARVFFTTSGTEANEAALLLATAYRRSNQVLALRNGYHGRSFGTVAVTGNRAWSPTSLSGLAVAYLQSTYRLRSPFRDLDDDAFTAAGVQDLRDTLDMCTAGDVACLLAEPIQGVGGFCVPPDGYFGALKDVLDAHGILFVSDEVQTGWGRTGEHFWGYQAHGVVPDVLTFAKGVGNGLALGGVVARAEVMNCLGAASISTFGGNPLACAGALANVEHILTNDLQGNALKMGQVFFDRLGSLPTRYPFVAEVRGRGLMVAVELCHRSGPGSVQRNDDPWPEAAAELLEATRRRGLLIGKGGLYGNVLRIAPPLSVTEDEAAEGLDHPEAAIHEIGERSWRS